MLAVTTNLDGATWAEMKEKGYARYTGVGMSPSQIGHATDYRAERDDHGEHLADPEEAALADADAAGCSSTSIIEFFFELGEELPDPQGQPAAGRRPPAPDDGRARHAGRFTPRGAIRPAPCFTLQRGEPADLHRRASDARRARDRKTEDRVRVYNDIGSFEIQAKVASARSARARSIVYHAWEPYQFEDGKSHQSLIPSPMNPIHLAGGYFQLQPTLLMGEPGCPDRGTRVEVERLAGGPQFSGEAT